MTEDGVLHRMGWVASKRHLATVVIVLLATGIASLVIPRTTHSKALEFHSGERLPVYLRVATCEWLVFGYLLFGIRRMGRTAGEVIDPSPGGPRRWFSSVGIGIGAGAVWMMLGMGIMALLRPNADDLRFVQSFLPRSMVEKFGFAALTLTAGFCEEFLYRGYLQQQFHAWTGSLTTAMFLQAGLFGLLHVSLPWKFVVSVTAMALFLGALVAWRKTLVPAMLLHAVVNLLGGLLSSP
ncbi:MAG: CPBP family intramembrane glutamic endopeptidase [Terriglobales bacterium]